MSTTKKIPAKILSVAQHQTAGVKAQENSLYDLQMEEIKLLKQNFRITPGTGEAEKTTQERDANAVLTHQLQSGKNNK